MTGSPITRRRRTAAAGALFLVAALVVGVAFVASAWPGSPAASSAASTAAAASSAATGAPSEPPVSPDPSPSPFPSASPEPSPSGPPTATPRPTLRPTKRPTRVLFAYLKIDLPVIVPSRTETFPMCNVAAYLPPFPFPGQGGTTYLYAHARTGMFLPILTASQKSNGAALLGRKIQVWTGDDQVWTYVVTSVRRRQHTLDWAFDLPPNSLVLQTSETPYRDGTKVMVVAREASVAPAPYGDAHPTAHPVACQ